MGRSKLRPLTLVAATDGNHGRAVARVAKWFGLGARIYLPSFVSPARCKAIELEGAELVMVDGVYDASVDAAVEAGGEPGALLISDTARSASDVVPRLVTAGYSTAFAEIEEQLSKSGDDRIDVVSSAGRRRWIGVCGHRLGAADPAWPLAESGGGRAGAGGLRHDGSRRRRADDGVRQRDIRDERAPMRDDLA